MRLRKTAALAVLVTLGQAGQAQDSGLKIFVLEGEGAFNNVKRRVGRDPVVEVRDDSGRPVAGAAVSFTLPISGAGGTFLNGSRTFATTTDEQGRAASKGLKPNFTEGRFNIHVIASANGKGASAVISQSNTLAGGSIAGAQAGGRGDRKSVV